MNLQDLVKVCSNYSSNRASFSNNNYIGAIVFSKFFYIVFLSPSKLFKTFLKTFSTIFREYEGRRLAHCRVSAIRVRNWRTRAEGNNLFDKRSDNLEDREAGDRERGCPSRSGEERRENLLPEARMKSIV